MSPHTPRNCKIGKTSKKSTAQKSTLPAQLDTHEDEFAAQRVNCKRKWVSNSNGYSIGWIGFKPRRKPKPEPSLEEYLVPNTPSNSCSRGDAKCE